jgi:DNA-directed RNA polymerase subunit RPC12/RpoP
MSTVSVCIILNRTEAQRHGYQSPASRSADSKGELVKLKSLFHFVATRKSPAKCLTCSTIVSSTTENGNTVHPDCGGQIALAHRPLRMAFTSELSPATAFIYSIEGALIRNVSNTEVTERVAQIQANILNRRKKNAIAPAVRVAIAVGLSWAIILLIAIYGFNWLGSYWNQREWTRFFVTLLAPPIATPALMAIWNWALGNHLR